MTDRVLPPCVEAGGAAGKGEGGVTLRRHYRAGEMSPEHVRSGGEKRRPGTKGMRHLAMCFFSLRSWTPFSVLSKSDGALEGGGQPRTEGALLLFEFPFFASAVAVCNVARWEQVCGVGGEQCEARLGRREGSGGPNRRRNPQ